MNDHSALNVLPRLSRAKLWTGILLSGSLLTSAAWADFALQYEWQEAASKDGSVQYVTGKQYYDASNGQERTDYYDGQGNLIKNPAQLGLTDKSWKNNTGKSLATTQSPATKTTSKQIEVPAFVLGGQATPISSSLDALTPGSINNIKAYQNQTPNSPPLIGIRRNLTQTLTTSPKSSWLTDPLGNQYLPYRIVVSNTQAIRIHLENIQLPVGAYFLVYATQKPTECRGPYNAAYLHGRNDLWTESIFATDVTLLACLPPGTNPNDIAFSIREIIDTFDFPLINSSNKGVGNCHLDVTCYPAWATEALAVAGIGTINVVGSIWCTGALLNDNSTPHGNYFMTAYHCVGSQAAANTTEYYWFYQTATCNGTPPSPSSVPRTGGGAEFLAGMNKNVGNDFCFLKLRQSVPAGVAYVGWTTDPVASHAAITGIHHPDGSFKRISFGTLQSSRANWWDVMWSQGVTEPGSSGSPLFNSNHLFVGQLWGGDSSCSDPQGIDHYGRFNVSYPIISQWLLQNDSTNSAIFVITKKGVILMQ